MYVLEFKCSLRLCESRTCIEYDSIASINKQRPGCGRCPCDSTSPMSEGALGSRTATAHGTARRMWHDETAVLSHRVPFARRNDTRPMKVPIARPSIQYPRNDRARHNCAHNIFLPSHRTVEMRS